MAHNYHNYNLHLHNRVEHLDVVLIADCKMKSAQSGPEIPLRHEISLSLSTHILTTNAHYGTHDQQPVHQNSVATYSIFSSTFERAKVQSFSGIADLEPTARRVECDDMQWEMWAQGTGLSDAAWKFPEKVLAKLWVLIVLVVPLVGLLLSQKPI